MRLIVLSTLLCLSSVAYSQSKKELKAEVARLGTEVDSLKKQVADLKKPKVVELDNEHKQASYGLGILMTSNLKLQGADSLNVDALVAAVKDVMLDQELKMDEQEAMAIVQPYMTKAMEQKTEAMKAEGLAFLEKNKANEGVKVTESGLQYKVLKSGTGKMPTAESEVTVHYTGKLSDGTTFDSSVERGEPATFGVGQVIAGWTEALQLMHVGDKWMLYIPSDLAYGERGAGGRIPPYAVLVFEIELLEVN